MSDQIVGGGILLISFSILVYYTLWAFAVPFLEANHPLLTYFPPYDWVIKGPILLLLIGGIFISAFIGSVILKSKSRASSKKSK
jgi:dolichyl-phosphate mannosyltransferase polypeptide 2 regulatory subunit